MKSLVLFSFLVCSFFSVAQCDGFWQDIISNEPTCHGFSDGSITVVVSGGTGGIIYTITDSDGIEINVDNSNTVNSLPTGTYSTLAADEIGCELEATLLLEEPGEMAIDLNTMISNSELDCDGYAVVDTVYNYTGDFSELSYFWFPNPTGEEGLGADSNYNFCPGPCFVTINDENGCSREFDFTIGELSGLAIEDQLKFAFLVNAGVITIQIENYSEPLAIDLFDNSGRLVFSQKLVDQNSAINPNLGKGLYLYAIRKENAVLSTGKFVLE